MKDDLQGKRLEIAKEISRLNGEQFRSDQLPSSQAKFIADGFRRDKIRVFEADLATLDNFLQFGGLIPDVGVKRVTAEIVEAQRRVDQTKEQLAELAQVETERARLALEKGIPPEGKSEVYENLEYALEQYQGNLADKQDELRQAVAAAEVDPNTDLLTENDAAAWAVEAQRNPTGAAGRLAGIVATELAFAAVGNIAFRGAIVGAAALGSRTARLGVKAGGAYRAEVGVRSAEALRDIQQSQRLLQLRTMNARLSARVGELVPEGVTTLERQAIIQRDLSSLSRAFADKALTEAQISLQQQTFIASLSAGERAALAGLVAETLRTAVDMRRELTPTLVAEEERIQSQLDNRLASLLDNYRATHGGRDPSGSDLANLVESARLSVEDQMSRLPVQTERPTYTPAPELATTTPALRVAGPDPELIRAEQAERVAAALSIAKEPASRLRLIELQQDLEIKPLGVFEAYELDQLTAPAPVVLSPAEPAEDAAFNPLGSSALDPAEDAAFDPLGSSAFDPAEDAAFNPLEDAAFDPAEDAAFDPAEDAATKTNPKDDLFEKTKPRTSEKPRPRRPIRPILPPLKIKKQDIGGVAPKSYSEWEAHKQGFMYRYFNRQTGEEVYSLKPLKGKVPDLRGKKSPQKSLRTISKTAKTPKRSVDKMGLFDVLHGPQGITFKKANRQRRKG